MDASNQTAQPTSLVAPAGGQSGATATQTAGLPDPARMSVGYLNEKLEAAEALLSYATEAGIELDESVRKGILEARLTAGAGGFTLSAAENLLTALAKLANKVRPVTVESLKHWAQRKEAKARGADERTFRARARAKLMDIGMEELSEIGALGWIAIVSGLIIMVFSVITFVTGNLSDKITKDIADADALVSKLRVELGPADPSTQTNLLAVASASIQSDTNTAESTWFGSRGLPVGVSASDVIDELQGFCRLMRELSGYSRQLRHFLPDYAGKNYYDTNVWSDIELKPGLKILLARELSDKTAIYQPVRYHASQVVDRVNVYYGAAGACVLPVLYALLGTVVYLLRLREKQEQAPVPAGRERFTARLLIGGISGLTVSQFSGFAGGANLSPFALAFLAGYAVDVYFAFLEGLLQAFKRGPDKS